MKVKSLSLVRLLATPWTVAHQAPPSMGFSRQECWSGVPLPSPIIYICLNHFAVHLKLTQHCKSAILQTKIIFLKNTNLGGFWASLVAQMVKNPPVMREIWVRSLGWEEPLEEEMVTHSSILAWRIPWTEESGGLQYLFRCVTQGHTMIQRFNRGAQF